MSKNLHKDRRPFRKPGPLWGCAVVIAASGIGCSDYGSLSTAGAPLLSRPRRGGDPNGPMIEVDQVRKDFGVVVSGTPLTHEFTVRNPGKKPLEIGNVRTSCGCTAALMSERTIPPGGSGTIRVSYTAEGSKPFSHFVNVYSNVEQLSPLQLDIVGISRYALEGPDRIHLGRLTSGELYTHVVELEAVQGVDFGIAKCGTSLPYIKAQARREGDSVKLTLTFDGRPAPEPIEGWVWIDTTREHDDRVVIPVRGAIVAPLEVAPARLYLGMVGPGRGAARSLLVRADQANIDRLQVHVDGPPWVTARIEPEGDEATIQVALGPEAKPGRSAGHLRIRAGEGEPIDVPFHAYVTKHVERTD